MMNRYKFFETINGKTFMTADLNGSELGEQFDGIKFQVTVNPEGTLDFTSENSTIFDQAILNGFVTETTKFIDPVTGDESVLILDEEGEDNSQKEGQYTLSKKLLSFTRYKGRVRISQDYAFIQGSQLTGIFSEGEVKIKLTICKNGTVDAEEIDTNKIDDAMMGRLLEDFTDVDTKPTYYPGQDVKFILTKYIFKDERGEKLYCEVEEETPMDKLLDAVDGTDTKLSKSGLSALDQLLEGMDDEDNEKDVTTDEDENVTVVEASNTVTAEEIKTSSDFNSTVEKAFAQMNEKRIEELEGRIILKERDLFKHENQIKTSKKLATQATNDIKLLRKRLETMKPKAEPNGYVYFVGEQQKFEGELDENTKEIATNMCKHLKLNEEVVLEALKKTFYEITIAPKDDLENKKFIYKGDTADAYKTLMTLDVEGDLIQNDKSNIFTYSGDMDWHQLCNRLSDIGFERSAEFDKMCGSNSYFSSQLGKADETPEVEKPSINEELKTLKFSDEMVTQKLNSYEDKTIFIVGGGNDHSDTGFYVDDDETSYSLYMGKKEIKTIGSMGWGGILSLKEYQQWCADVQEEWGEPLDYISGLIDAVCLPNFTGEIGITFKGDNGYSANFDKDTEIQHQFNDYGDVIVTIPEETNYIELNKLELPDFLVRDEKLGTLLN